MFSSELLSFACVYRSKVATQLTTLYWSILTDLTGKHHSQKCWSLNNNFLGIVSLYVSSVLVITHKRAQRVHLLEFIFHFLKARFCNIRCCFLVGKDCSLNSIPIGTGLPIESGWWQFVAVKSFVELCATLGNHAEDFRCELGGYNHLPLCTSGFF